MARRKLLIGDIGGTNARFALADDRRAGFSAEQTLQCAEFPTALDAIRYYLRNVGVAEPDAVCLAAAGPVVGGVIRLTNNNWTLSVAGLEEAFGTGHVRLLNDFAAIGYSVPNLAPRDLMQVGKPSPRALEGRPFMIGVIGPGTGLGCVGLRKFGEHLVLINSEASHSGFAPETRRQIDMLAALRDRLERVSSEALVSGIGIENLYWALAHLHGAAQDRLPASEIFARADAESDAVAVESVEMFFEILGQVAGDLALTFGAEDGIFIAGGIAQRYPERLKSSRFREGFDRKGGHTYLVERIPTQLITHRQPGLLGAAWCALQIVNDNGSA
ncbi:MAG TPA: glucokinase [Woeseiaceae bacterium]|nr:glucokinase [Woeseiaceae bacterium]